MYNHQSVLIQVWSLNSYHFDSHKNCQVKCGLKSHEVWSAVCLPESNTKESALHLGLKEFRQSPSEHNTQNMPENKRAKQANKEIFSYFRY